MLRGEGPQPRSAALAGRLVRVLTELGLVALDREGPALEVAESPQRTALEHSAAFTAYQRRFEDGRQYLTSSNRGERHRRQPERRRRPAGRRGADRGRRAPAGRPRRARRRRHARAARRPDDARARAARRPVRDRLRARRRGRRPGRPQRPSCARSCSPASTTPTSAASPARTSSPTRSAWPRSAPACGWTPRRCAPRCCTTRSRTRRRSLDEVREEFGDEVAGLVDGVTKLTGITFQSRDEAQAENYRKMMVAMATDIRVILIKLADRLHNMRTLGAMPKQKQIEKAKETLEIYAPLAHRLGIHAIKWELEDLAFATLHPRKYQEIKGLVNQQREERERYVAKAGGYLAKELEALGIRSEISGRAKHFYSIYSKMTRKGREFNEIYDLTAMRVIVDSVKDCYGAVGVIHSLWKPLPGPLQGHGGDAEVQHVPGAAHDGDRARGAPAGDPDPHRRHARDGRVRRRRALALQGEHEPGPAGPDRPEAQVAEVAAGLAGRPRRPDGVHRPPARRADRGRGLRLHAQGRGQVARRPAPRRWTSPTRSTPTSATAASARASTARSCRCTTSCSPATSSRSSPPSASAARRATGWRWSRRPARATRSRRGSRPSRATTPSTPAASCCRSTSTRPGLPAQKLTGSPLLADVIRELGFKKADDFYIALGGAKISPKVVVNKVLQRLKQGEAGVEEPSPGEDLLLERRKAPALRRPDGNAAKFGIRVEGV